MNKDRFDCKIYVGWGMLALVALFLTASIVFAIAQTPTQSPALIQGLPPEAEVVPVQVNFDPDIETSENSALGIGAIALEGWQLAFANSFEGTLEIGDWSATDGNGSTNGDYYWGPTDYTSASSSHSMWAIGNGLDGSLLDPATDVYTDNVDSWFIIGPVNMSQILETELQLQTSMVTQAGDQLQLLTSPDGSAWSGAGFTFDGLSTTGWFSISASLDAFVGQPEVWFAIRFVSNDDGLAGAGVFIDDIYLRVNYGYDEFLPVACKDYSPPTSTPTQTPTPEPTATSSVYFDDFSNASSGWPSFERLIEDTTSYYRVRYQGGQYRFTLDLGGPLAWFYQPNALAPYTPPSNKYCIEVDVKFEKGQHPYENQDYYPYWANAGLIFGASEDSRHLYAMCIGVGAETSPGEYEAGWFIVHNPEYEFPRKGCNFSNGVVAGEGVGLDLNAWHRFKVGVDNNNVTIYIDEHWKGNWTMDGLRDMTRVGLVGGDYEVTPTDIRFDNFKVIPNANCSP